MRQALICTIGFLVIFSFSASVWGEDQRVTGKGMATLVETDTVIARDQAIQDALRKVVEQSLGLFVSTKTQVQDFELIREDVFTRSSGFIKKYAITSENISKELNTYIVAIEATISMGQLDQEIAALLSPAEKSTLVTQQGQPRIMVKINENFVGLNGMSGQSSFPMSSQVGSLVMNELRRKGFQFVQPSIQAQGESRGGYQHQDRDAHPQADILISGEVIASSGGAIQGTIMKPIHASLFLRAVHIDGGKFICEVNDQKTVPHISAMAGASEAIKAVSENLVPTFADLVFSNVAQFSQSPKMVHMKIHVKDFLQLLQLESSLRRNVQGIQNLFRRSYAAKVGKVDIEFKGDAMALANELSSSTLDSTLKVEVLETSRNQLVLKTIQF